MSECRMWIKKAKQNRKSNSSFFFGRSNKFPSLFSFIYSLSKYCNFGYSVMNQKQQSKLWVSKVTCLCNILVGSVNSSLHWLFNCDLAFYWPIVKHQETFKAAAAAQMGIIAPPQIIAAAQARFARRSWKPKCFLSLRCDALETRGQTCARTHQFHRYQTGLAHLGRIDIICFFMTK